MASEPAYYDSATQKLVNPTGVSGVDVYNGDGYVPNAWAITVQNTTSSAVSARVEVTCADATNPTSSSGL